MLVRNIHEAKTQLSQLINQVVSGEDVVIAKAGKPLVKLVPYQPDKKERTPGLLKGKIKFIGDFDTDNDLIESLFYGQSDLNLDKKS